MNWLDLFTVLTTLLGLLFFLAGTLGIIRFPEVFSRLHALTKADNLGLGLIAMGLIPHVSGPDALQLILIWLLVMLAGAVCSFLIAHSSFSRAEQQERDANSLGQDANNEP